MAGLLAILLLLLGLVAANDPLHHSFHHDRGQGGNPCAVCLLVKGHLESPTLAPVVLACVSPRVGAVPLEVGTLPAFTYLAAPSRAPPALASALPVVV